MITKTQGLLAMSFEFPILHNGHRSFSITEECYRLKVLTALMDKLVWYSSILNEYLKVFKINTATQLFHLVRLTGKTANVVNLLWYDIVPVIWILPCSLITVYMSDLLLFAELVFRCSDLLSMQYLFSKFKIEL